MEENKVASDKELREAAARLVKVADQATEREFYDACFRELVAVRDRTRESMAEWLRNNSFAGLGTKGSK